MNKTESYFTTYFLLGLLICITLSSCDFNISTSSPYEGVWSSIGYGRILKIEEDNFLLADVTDISCEKTLSGSLSEFENYGISSDTLWIKDAINIYQFTKIDDAPIHCKKGQALSDPHDLMHNFEVLSSTFEDHYAYFEERNIDWPKTYERYKSQMEDVDSAPQLYNLIDNMLSTFDDGHITLSAPDSIVSLAQELIIDKTTDSNPTNLKKYSRFEVADAVAEHYFKTIQSRKSGLIKWGILDGNIGYLQLNQMMGFADYIPNDTLDVYDYWRKYFEIGESKSSIEHGISELKGFNSIIKEAMSDLSKTSSIIIDLRFNSGGKDELGLALLEYFNSNEQVVFCKFAVAGTDFTPKNCIKLKSKPEYYDRPVSLLISDASASATEILVLAGKSLNNITTIGGTTNGVFSDMLDKTLPNGWEFSLSNEIYHDLQGNSYEGKGIEPQIIIEHHHNKDVLLNQIMNHIKSEGDPAIDWVLAQKQ